jgi:anionic cell wall polymer biosynthesis LytR-Cps2A-Psr (LCP) family protein
MKTVFFYPLDFPITPYTRFYYFESPSPNSNSSNLQDLFQKFYIYIDTNIPLSNNEYILMNLKLHRKLGSNNQLNLQYKVLYHDKSKNVVIRADNNHPYPHIDLELPNRKQKKEYLIRSHLIMRLALTAY